MCRIIQKSNTLVESNLLDYYIIETNYSQAHYFNEYLETGDIELLKELVSAFESIVIQEDSIEIYQHWQNIKKLKDANPHSSFVVLGFDVINEYKFPIRHLLQLAEKASDREKLKELKQKLENPSTNFSVWSSEWNEMLRGFIQDYRENKKDLEHSIADVETFEFILKNIEYNLNKNGKRGAVMYENYLYWHDRLKFHDKKQFAKYGFSHILKDKEDISIPPSSPNS